MTQFSNFAVRVLMYAGLKGETPSSIPEIARAYGISHNHLKKVVPELCQLGYLETVRGRVGGVRLSQPVDKIGIGEVVRQTEGRIVLVECFEPTRSTCPLTPVCRLKRALNEAMAAFFAVLDGYTLADLIAAPDELQPLLGLRQRASEYGEHGAEAEER